MVCVRPVTDAHSRGGDGGGGAGANSIKNRFNAKHFQTAFKAFEAQCDATASAAAASSSASSSAAEAPPPPDF